MNVQKWIDRHENLVIGTIVLAALLYLWPNLIHEPLHWITLKLFGGSGSFSFDFTHWPAEPHSSFSYIPSVLAGVMYRIAPSLFSVIILITLWMTRRSAALLTHVMLPLYLTFDLLVNITGQGMPTNDFHFLTVLNPAITYVLLIGILVLGGAVIAAGMRDELNEQKKRNTRRTKWTSESA